MPDNTNPAWRGGARRKAAFWSNGSADNKDLISNTQAGLCRHDGGQPRHVMTALSPGEARSSLRDHRVDLYETPDFIGDVVLERARMTPNVVQRGDGLTLLRSLPDGCTPVVFFDPQHSAVLDKLQYGNEGVRQKGRAGLPSMSDSYILDCLRESVRALTRSGYLMLWCDTYNLCQARHLQIASICPPVDLIAWDNLQMGMSYRTRRRGDYLLILQKPRVRAKATWRDHGIPNRWAEKVDRRLHCHVKPIGLISRLISAVTEPGDLVVDPAAGSFVAMRAAHQLGRNFIGCDLKLREDGL